MHVSLVFSGKILSVFHLTVIALVPLIASDSTALSPCDVFCPLHFNGEQINCPLIFHLQNHRQLYSQIDGF